MGRVCQICLRERPHEQFGGKGERARVCKRCRQLPRVERRRIMATDEVLGFLRQSNISKKNIKRLEALATIEEPTFQTLRMLVLDIAHTHPHRRKRWGRLRVSHPNIVDRAVAGGLLDDFIDPEDAELPLEDDCLEDGFPGSMLDSDDAPF